MGASDQLLRLTAAAYADGVAEMRAGPEAVPIAMGVFDQDGDMPNSLGVSNLFINWGQFLDHDLDLSPDASPELIFAEGLVAPIRRSAYDPATGIDGPREQVNVITPEMDGSQIYGSDAARTEMLRAHEGGRLLSSDGMMPTTEEAGMMAGSGNGTPVFLAGDVRANENTGLTTLHTLFVREHNYWADRIADAHPDWSDDKIFAAARSVVEAELQKITYEDWLPKLIGGAVGAYGGHDAGVSTQVTQEFSTAAFRFGHTMISSTIARVNEDGSTIDEGNLSVMGAFFNNAPMYQAGIDSILRGLSSTKAQERDAKVIDDLNMFLTMPDGVTGFSLPAINILRGREHGIDTYVNVRAQVLGDIDPATLDPHDFSIITRDAARQAELAAVYATVHEVDLWVGGIAEDSLPGTLQGATFTAIIAEQFTRTRAGDATWGQIDPDLGAEISEEIANTSLSDIILRNTDIDYMQADAFQQATRIMGTDSGDWLNGTSGDDLVMAEGGSDTVYGREGNDTIYAGAGRDVVYGGAGADELRGGSGHDRLYGEDGDDRLYAGNGDDRVEGGRGDDMLRGGRGEDYLDGGSGNDTITGGRDDDTMRGGWGDDTFVFSKGDGDDRIDDFRSGDVIELNGYEFESFSDLMSHATQTWRGVRFDFGEDSIFLSGVYKRSLDAGDFDVEYVERDYHEANDGGGLFGGLFSWLWGRDDDHDCGWH